MSADGATLLLLAAFATGALVLAALLWLGWEGGHEHD